MLGLDVDRALLGFFLLIFAFFCAACVVIACIAALIVGVARFRRKPFSGLGHIAGSVFGIAVVSAGCYWLFQPRQPSTEPMAKILDVSSSRDVHVLGEPDERGTPEHLSFVEGDPGSDIYTYEGQISLIVRLPGHRQFDGKATEVTVGVDATTRKIAWIGASLGPFRSPSQAYRSCREIIRRFGAATGPETRAIRSLRDWYQSPKHDLSLGWVKLTDQGQLPKVYIDLDDGPASARFCIEWF